MLREVLGPSGAKSLKKVSRRVRKASKKSENDSSRPFGLFETYFRLLGPEGPRTVWRHVFETFGVWAR